MGVSTMVVTPGQDQLTTWCLASDLKHNQLVSYAYLLRISEE